MANEKIDIYLQYALTQLMIINMDKDIGYIYCLIEHYSIESKKNIYKIGRTSKTMHERMKGYTKGSELQIQCRVENLHEAENELIKEMRIQFPQKGKLVGTESFEADIKEIIKTIMVVLEKYLTNVHVDIFSEENIEKNDAQRTVSENSAKIEKNVGQKVLQQNIPENIAIKIENKEKLQQNIPENDAAKIVNNGIVHNVPQNKKAMLVCEVCGEKFYNKSTMERHMSGSKSLCNPSNAHKLKNSFECILCHKRFRYDTNLCTHKKKSCKMRNIVANNAPIENNAIVGDDAVMGDNPIIGKNNTVRNNNTVGDNAAIGNNATIGNNNTVTNNVENNNSTNIDKSTHNDNITHGDNITNINNVNNTNIILQFPDSFLKYINDFKYKYETKDDKCEKKEKKEEENSKEEDEDEEEEENSEEDEEENEEENSKEEEDEEENSKEEEDEDEEEDEEEDEYEEEYEDEEEDEDEDEDEGEDEDKISNIKKKK